MLRTKNLRNRVITEQSHEELGKNNKVSTKSKLNDIENKLVDPVVTRYSKLSDGKNIKVSNLLPSKTCNKPVKNGINKKTSCRVDSDEMFVQPAENQGTRKRKTRRETGKESILHKSKMVLREKKFNIKNKKSMNLIVEKQGSSSKEDQKIKEYSKPDTCRMSVVHPLKKCAYEKNCKISTEFQRYIPVWNKMQNLNKSMKKQIKTEDVYDIALDEELMASFMEGKKKKITSKKVPKRVRKKKFPSKNRNFNTLACVNRQALKINQMVSDACNKIALTEIKEPLTAKENVENVAPKLHYEDERHVNSSESLQINDQNKTLDLSATLSVNVQNETLDYSEPHLQSLEPKCQKNKFLFDLADEVEKSFLIPKMTSTPDKIHRKPVNQIHKDAILVSNISNITCTNNNCLNVTVDTPYEPASDGGNLLKKEKGKDFGNITLFESPKKKRRMKLKSSKRSIQLNLFGEAATSPPIEHNLEDTVLKGRKSYTPDNFKKHLARTKKTAEINLKKIKKSKEELAIEKMTQHFEEIGGSELCIE